MKRIIDMRRLNSLTDHLIAELQHGLKTCHAQPPLAARGYPAAGKNSDDLVDTEIQHVAGLMRVNNAGEVAAQALYRGQALTASKQVVRDAMKHAAEEENEHLNWCQQRLSELGANRSNLDGIWYWGSFTIGAVAGAIGDRWSLGFVQETEEQVSHHLQEHLTRLPESDGRSRAIIQTMQTDEQQHADNARNAGAANLPLAVKSTMRWISRIMTATAYRF
ncbi:MAG: ubiquinone biosynthesis monooxygenase Coq7 [Gammaproteobacteria bacterium]